MDNHQIALTGNYEDQKFELVADLDEEVLTIKYQLLSLLELEPEDIQITIVSDGSVTALEADKLLSHYSELLKRSEYTVRVSNVLRNSVKPSDFFNLEDSIPEFILREIEWDSCCSRVYFGDTLVKQPRFLIDNMSICVGCSSTCQQMQKKQFPNSKLEEAFSCDCQLVCQKCLYFQRIESKQELLGGLVLSKLQQIVEQAYLKQKNENNQKKLSLMKRKLEVNANQVFDFEVKDNHGLALKEIPLSLLKERARDNKNPLPGRDELLRQLLRWFKKDFFKWVNKAACDYCSGETESIGNDRANEKERKYGAGIAELYKCKNCERVTRFPRYNNSGKLMQTKRGRCGSLHGLVVDWTDHVWTEVYSEHCKRWIHCDSCEDAFDSPLMYESGWNKKISYVIAFSAEEVRDVTLRYTRNFSDVLKRRIICSEEWLKCFIVALNKNRLSWAPQKLLTMIENRWKMELSELENPDILRELREKERIGRETGSIVWKAARGELGEVRQQGLEVSGSAIMQQLNKNDDDLENKNILDK